jgi:hypothetical protein
MNREPDCTFYFKHNEVWVLSIFHNANCSTYQIESENGFIDWPGIDRQGKVVFDSPEYVPRTVRQWIDDKIQVMKRLMNARGEVK